MRKVLKVFIYSSGGLVLLGITGWCFCEIFWKVLPSLRDAGPGVALMIPVFSVPLAAGLVMALMCWNELLWELTGRDARYSFKKISDE